MIEQKIGTLYDGLRPVPNVKINSLVFLMRRSMFVILTFYLFERPNLQVLSMMLMTLIYITIVSWANYYTSASAKTLEVMNEVSFCLI